MIFNNVHLILNGELVKRDVEFTSNSFKISKDLKAERDCNGTLLIPGLRNSHVHLASRLVSGSAIGMGKYEYFDSIGFKVHDRRSEKDVYQGALLACLESLKHGVTHVDTMDMHPEPVIKAIEEVGLDYTACLPLKDYHKEGRDVEAQFKHTRALIKNPNVVVGLANEYECTPQLIRQAFDLAKEIDKPIHTHACETLEEVKHFKQLTGKRTIQYYHEMGLLDYDVRIAHCTYTDSKEALYLAMHDTEVLHCPTSNEAISNNLPPIKSLVRNNGRVSIGTDSFAWNPSVSVLKESFKSFEETNITPLQAFNLTHNDFSNSFSLVELKDLKPFNSVNGLLIKLMMSEPISEVYLHGKQVVKDGVNKLGVNEGKLKGKVERIKLRLLD